MCALRAHYVHGIPMGIICTAKKPLLNGYTLHYQKSPLYLGMWTPYTTKKPPTNGHGGTLHCQKGYLHMGMGTLCTAKKPPTYGHGDTLHCQKGALDMGMGTLCTAKKAPDIWAWMS